MKWLRLLLILVVMSGAGAPAFAVETSSIALHLKLAMMRSAGPPQLLNRTIIFSYKPRTPVRYAGIALGYEQYRTVHLFVKNQHGVYLLPLTVPADVTSLTYRFVADGLWMPDPNNPATVTDPNGIILSYYDLKNLPPPQIVSPRVEKDGDVQFFLSFTAGKKVMLVGDFDNWDPTMYRMSETSPGMYSTQVTLTPGDHYYYYIADGRRMLDPLNSAVGVSNDGTSASRLVVPTP